MTIKDIRDAYQVREGYWFAPKLFGLGATPVTWQGWMATAVFIALALAISALVPDHAMAIAAVLAITVPFLMVVWLKTDGGWRWHWGWRR